MEISEYLTMYQAQSLHWWYVTRRLFLQTFLKGIPSGSHKKILDVGCGTGANTQVFHTIGKVTGLDSSPLAKKLYTKNREASFVVGSATKIPLQDTQFDVVALCDVLYHKNVTSPYKALQESYRILKSGGYCIITDCVHPFLFGSHDIKNQARERFTKRKLEKLVGESGFILVRSSYTFMMTFPLLFLVRLLDRCRKLPLSSMEERVSKPINILLGMVGKFENAMLMHWNLPIGSSVILLAKKA